MLKYRADVEGLRALAVGSIVLYHFGLQVLGGGYVGVDIFFVISGFLIGKSIVDQIISGKFSFIDFAERRARRLIPSLYIMLIISMLAFLVIMLPFDLRNFGKSIIGTVFYGSNIIFFKESGYFDQGAVFKPLLHTWSLAVEEQFYVVIPVLLLATMKISRNRTIALSCIFIVALVSFSAAQFMMKIDASASFFLLPFRAWELLTGVMLGFLRPDWLVAKPRMFRELAALFAMLLIGIPIFTYTHDTPFPGVAALPIVFGTALLIYIGASGTTYIGRFLALRPFALIGLISYSLYLWHWPIVVGINYYSAGAPSIGLLIAGGCLTIVLSLLSFRFIEEPIRRRRLLADRKHFVIALVTTSAGLLVVSAIFYKTEGLPQRFSVEEQAIATASGDFLQRGGICFGTDNTEIPGLAFCRLGDQSASPSFLIWGDSHGRAFRDGLDLAANEAKRSGLLVWNGGCPPLIGVKKRESAGSPAQDRFCYDQNRLLQSYLETDQQLKSVLLIGRWAYYSEGRGVGADDHNSILISVDDGAPTGAKRVFEDAMDRTVMLLKRQGRQVFILEQVPEIPSFNARVFAQRVLSRGEAASSVLQDIGVIHESEIKRRQNVAEHVFSKLERDHRANIIRTHSLFCPDGQCSAWLDERPALFDNNHITVHTSQAVRKIFSPMLIESVRK